jgi:arginine deiminase
LVSEKGWFLDFMEKEGFTVFDIPKEEQLRYATNFLNLDPETVVVPFSDNRMTAAHFKEQEITVLPVEISELSGGYGAIHCMTSALRREH